VDLEKDEENKLDEIRRQNEEILNMVQKDRKILNTIWWRKHKWMGHVLRHDGLLHDVLEGRMLGKRTRGRRRIQLIDDLLEKKTTSINLLKRHTEHQKISN